MENEENMICEAAEENSKDADLIAGLRAEVEDLREMLDASEGECARLMRTQSIKTRWEEQDTERRSTFFTGLGFGLTLSIFLYMGLKYVLQWIGISDEFTVTIGCWVVIEALAFVITMYHLWLAKAVDRLIGLILGEADDDMVGETISRDRKYMAEEARHRAENRTAKCNGKR